MLSYPFPHKKVRSFVRRGGRLSDAKEFALEYLLPQYGLVLEKSNTDAWQNLFPIPQQTTLEIGFGMGNSLIHLATSFPEKNFLGIEVHRPGIANVLQDIHRKQLNNLRIIEGDAVEFLKSQVPVDSFSAIYLFFPDPWPKKRHHKRRILQPEFVDLIANCLKPQGIFHSATDWENYAAQMLDVLSSNSRLKNLTEANGYSPPPDYRLETKFEARGKALGHQVWDLIFKKV